MDFTGIVDLVLYLTVGIAVIATTNLSLVVGYIISLENPTPEINESKRMVGGRLYLIAIFIAQPALLVLAILNIESLANHLLSNVVA